MSNRNWRDVARLARMHKFDRFQKSNSNDKNENENPMKQEEKEEKTSNVPEAKSMPSRFASMDFRRPTKNADFFKPSEQTKRSSWAAGSVDAEKRFSSGPPPPPPPKPSMKAESPLQSENKSDAPNVVPPNIPKKETANNCNETDSQTRTANVGIDSENKVPFGTPSKPKIDSQRTSTPLQERTNIPVAEPPTTAKKATSKAKPFARLLKENGISYYEMLEIAEDASEKDILKSFRSWAKLVHPDHNKQPSATEDFQALQQIYETLRVPKSRLAYNCRQRIRRCAFGARSMRSAGTVPAAC